MSMLILEDHGGRIAYFQAMYPTATIVKTAQEAIEKLQSQSWNQASLDHDLNGESFVDSSRDDCGMEVVRWIVANKPMIEQIIVHTANRKASELMYDALMQAGYDTVRVPFGGIYDDRQ